MAKETLTQGSRTTVTLTGIIGGGNGTWIYLVDPNGAYEARITRNASVTIDGDPQRRGVDATVTITGTIISLRGDRIVIAYGERDDAIDLPVDLPAVKFQ